MVEVEKSPAPVKGRLGGVNKVFFVSQKKDCHPVGWRLGGNDQNNLSSAFGEGGHGADEHAAHHFGENIGVIYGASGYGGAATVGGEGNIRSVMDSGGTVDLSGNKIARGDVVSERGVRVGGERVGVVEGLVGVA